ncbi:unnamed protein product [Nesidiocoris tenuis]|uniref:Uncharacterized protein n=1 Tax=Nesidiocoris tenuis TaxID=355587 RepID=A0A6H5HKX9_9HEMI|nr:unnamed protein product [Nesidiocoris tenuis]
MTSFTADCILNWLALKWNMEIIFIFSSSWRTVDDASRYRTEADGMRPLVPRIPRTSCRMRSSGRFFRPRELPELRLLTGPKHFTRWPFWECYFIIPRTQSVVVGSIRSSSKSEDRKFIRNQPSIGPTNDHVDTAPATCEVVDKRMLRFRFAYTLKDVAGPKVMDVRGCAYISE